MKFRQGQWNPRLPAPNATPFPEGLKCTKIIQISQINSNIWLLNSPSYTQTHASPGLEDPHVDSTDICRAIYSSAGASAHDEIQAANDITPQCMYYVAHHERKIVSWHQVILTNLPIHHHLNIYLWSEYVILNNHGTTPNFILLGNLVKSEHRNIMNFGWPGLMNWRPQLNSREGKQISPRRNAAARCH